MPESGLPSRPRVHLDADTLTELVLGLAAEDAVAQAIAHAGECAVCEARLRETVGDLESFRARGTAMPELAAAPANAGERRLVALPRRPFALRWAIPLAWTFKCGIQTE